MIDLFGFDLEKLTPAPWSTQGHELYYGPVAAQVTHQQISKVADAAFIALARNAFDVLMRRGWIVYGHFPPHNGWAVAETQSSLPLAVADDPFTAIMEADKAWEARK